MYSGNSWNISTQKELLTIKINIFWSGNQKGKTETKTSSLRYKQIIVVMMIISSHYEHFWREDEGKHKNTRIVDTEEADRDWVSFRKQKL